MNLISYSFTLEGEFSSILGLIYSLEQQNNFGQIKNLYFEKTKNYKTWKTNLSCAVILQSIK